MASATDSAKGLRGEVGAAHAAERMGNGGNSRAEFAGEGAEAVGEFGGGQTALAVENCTRGNRRRGCGRNCAPTERGCGAGDENRRRAR